MGSLLPVEATSLANNVFGADGIIEISVVGTFGITTIYYVLALGDIVLEHLTLKHIPLMYFEVGEKLHNGVFA